MGSEIFTILFLVIYNIIYGYFESNLFARGFHPGKNDLFGTISSQYHLPMLLWLGTPALLLGYLYLIPALLVVEDQSYFLFEVRDELDSEDWIARMFGYQKILGLIIPNAYYLLLISSLTLWAI